MQAASQIFFNKAPRELDLQQAALLAGLPQAPSEYNPFLNPHAAKERRNEVLGKMAELGYVSQARAQAAEQAPLEAHHGDIYTQRREDFFFEYVRNLLEKRYGASTVEQGGLKVYTTINLRMQKDAREAIAKVLYAPEDPASAIVTINPANGDIQAMAESESFKQSQFNLAADGHRQPGSTFKGIDLADALSKASTRTRPTTSHTRSKGWLPAYPEYEVRTFEGTSLNKSISLLSATLASDNTVYAQLAADMGEESVTQTAYAMGVKVHLKSYAAEALGGLEYGVTPLEMADVYATLADGGWRNEPIAITKVVFPDGRTDTNWGTPHRTKVLSERRDIRGDRNPPRQRPRGHRRALRNPLLHGREDRHDDRTGRRLARRLHAELRDVGVDGLPEFARADDRRSGRTAAGRRAAGRDLENVYGIGRRRPGMQAVPAAHRTDRIPPVLRQVRARGQRAAQQGAQ